MSETNSALTSSSLIRSVSADQGEIIRSILKLHLKSETFDADVTFSVGNFYKTTGVREPDFKSDLEPSRPDVVAADAATLPVGNGVFGSIVFDPPFLVGPSRSTKGKMESRFGMPFSSVPKMWAWYEDCVREFVRVLRPGGYLVVKCQDTVSNHRQYWSHVAVMNMADREGLICVDLFVLIFPGSRPQNRRQINQHHARKYHSYFLVFQKPKTGRFKKGLA